MFGQRNLKNWKNRIYMDDNLNLIVLNFHYFDRYIWKWKKKIINYNTDDMTSNEDDLKIVILEQVAN